VHVAASLEAGRFVRERGGELYVWFRPLGSRSGWGSLRVSTSPPAADDVAFEQIHTGAFELFLDEALPRPEELAVTLEGRFRRRIRVRGMREGFAATDGDPTASDWVIFDSAGGVGAGDGGGGNGGGG